MKLKLKIPLSLASQGQKVMISSYNLGKSLQRQLMHLGLRRNKVLNIQTKCNDGRMVIGNNEFRIALGVDTTERILIQVI